MYFSLRLSWDNNVGLQYSGSVAYLFPLTVATVLEGDAVCISDLSRLLTSNLTVHSRINYLRWQVFSIATVPLEIELVRGIYSFVARVSPGRTYGKSTVINSGIL